MTKLENTSNFTEFVKIFTDFGNEMVELAHRSGDRQNDLKSEKRQAQMCVARSCLERMTMLLLTSSKTLLRHPDDQAARQCRDGVFHEVFKQFFGLNFSSIFRKHKIFYAFTFCLLYRHFDRKDENFILDSFVSTANRCLCYGWNYSV